MIFCKRLLCDGHFSTKEMIEFLREEANEGRTIDFLMKIRRSRIVEINGEKGQLQDLLRLKKNSHVESARGIMDGHKYWFHVVKRHNGSLVYLISNDKISRNNVLDIYNLRWNIEMFHRTSKQSLGLGDCQMQSIESQVEHALSVMSAYAYASIQTHNYMLPSVETFISMYKK